MALWKQQATLDLVNRWNMRAKFSRAVLVKESPVALARSVVETENPADELWATMQKAMAIPRAFAWFKGALAALKGVGRQAVEAIVEARGEGPTARRVRTYVAEGELIVTSGGMECIALM